MFHTHDMAIVCDETNPHMYSQWLWQQRSV